MRINLVVGDWSDDGHGKTETHYYNVSVLSKDVLAKAFEVGSEVLAHDFTEFCEDYDHGSIPVTFVATLREHGLPDDMVEEFFDETIEDIAAMDDGDFVGISAEAFADLWMWVARLGNPGISYDKSKEDDTLNIGGYGLFA